MRKLLMLALIPCFSVFGLDKAINVSEFNRVVLMGKAIVHVKQSDKESLTVSGSKNAIDEVSASVKYGELMITHAKKGWFGGFFHADEPPTYTLTVKDLQGITLKGSGEIIGDGPIKSELFRLVIEGAGRIDLDLTAKDFKASIFGAGKVHLAGSAEKQEVDIEGRGVYEGKDFITNRGKLMINGSGDAEINAAEELDITINGSGNVVYFGKPKVAKHISGHGTVINK